MSNQAAQSNQGFKTVATEDESYDGSKLPSWQMLVAAVVVLILLGIAVSYSRNSIPGLANNNGGRDLGYLSVAAKSGYVQLPPPKPVFNLRPLTYAAPLPPPVEQHFNVSPPATSVAPPTGSVVSMAGSFQQKSISLHCAKCGAEATGSQYAYPSQDGCPNGGQHLWIPDGHPRGG